MCERVLKCYGWKWIVVFCEEWKCVIIKWIFFNIVVGMVFLYYIR